MSGAVAGKLAVGEVAVVAVGLEVEVVEQVGSEHLYGTVLLGAGEQSWQEPGDWEEREGAKPTFIYKEKLKTYSKQARHLGKLKTRLHLGRLLDQGGCLSLWGWLRRGLWGLLVGLGRLGVVIPVEGRGRTMGLCSSSGTSGRGSGRSRGSRGARVGPSRWSYLSYRGGMGECILPAEIEQTKRI